jgi:hypothetical protein
MANQQTPPADPSDPRSWWPVPGRPVLPAGAGTGDPSPPGAPGWPRPGPAPWQPPGYPPWQVPPPRDRSRRVAWLVGSAAVVVTALIAGSIGYVIGDQHSRIEAAALGASAADSGCGAGKIPTSSATSQDGAALMARLMPMPSGGSPVTVLKQGQLSLDDYVHQLYATGSDEQQRLTALCFQAAVHRTWLMPSGTEVSIWLIQFGSAADARSYALGTEQADIAAAGNTVKFTVPGVADGIGIANPNLDKYGETLTHLLGDRGDVAILIHLYIPAGLNNATAVQVLQDQNARL